MHDLVRDVALRIAFYRKEFSFMIKSGVERLRDENIDPYTAMSFKRGSIDEIAQGLVCPNLKILLVGGDYSVYRHPPPDLKTITRGFFEGMKALKVCALQDLQILSDAFQFQANLRTLHLDGCSRYCDISLLGKLNNLQVLSSRHSDILELPEEIGDLSNLRLLDLSYCHYLWKIPHRLIQRLSKLEELYLYGCRSIEWATETGSTQAASVLELNSLPNLTVLSLYVRPEDLPKDFVFGELKGFDIYIGIIIGGFGCGGQRKEYETGPISISLKIEASVLHACKRLLEDIEILQLSNLVGNQNLMPQGFLQSLKVVKISSCQNLRCLFPAPVAKSLGKLETLLITYCSELEEIIPKTDVSNICLQSLRELRVEDCKKLTSLSSLSHGQILEKLTQLTISGCSQLEYTFPISMAEALPQLKEVRLMDSAQLKGRDGNDVVLNLPSLQELEVTNCPLLTPFIISAKIQL